MSTAIYNRISKDATGEGLGVARQERECRALAKRLGWNDITLFQDNDISASSGKHRPEYSALCEAIEDGSINRLIVWHPDRLHRRPAELETFVELAEKAKLEVATVQSGQLDLSSPGGRLVARIVGSVARAEMELKSERSKAKFAEQARAGIPAGGNRTYGWTEGMRSIIPSEAAALQEAAERVVAGEPVRAVAADFNRREIPTTTGGQWWGQVLRKMLVNPRLIAKRVYRGEVIGDAQWEPILNPDTFASVEAILTDPRRVKARKGEVYPLSGLMEDHRGYLMGGAPGSRSKPIRRYRTNVPSGVANTQIGAATVEPIVFGAILTLTDSESLPLLSGSEPDIASVKGLLAEIEELAALKGAGTISTAEWLAAREPLAERLKAAEENVRAVRSVPAWLRDLEKPGALRRAWAELDNAQRRQAVALFVDKVVIGPTDGKGNGGDPASRVSVVWRG